MPAAMKAAVFYDVEDIRLEDVPEPTIGDEDVLVEVTACGICGSDLEYYMGRSPVGTADGKGPLILGHEFAGRVVKLGKDALYAQQDMAFGEALEYQRAQLAIALSTHDVREGVAAFMERREPTWSGR